MTSTSTTSSTWRGALSQALVFAAMATAVMLLFRNFDHNLQSRGVLTGFAFLDRVARIPVANAPLAFEPGVSTYAFALLVGALNTLKVSVVAIVLATLLGTALGLGRLSSNWLLSRLCFLYVEAFRNVPVLVHILICYQLLVSLPNPGEALHPLAGVFISNRGMSLPALHWQGGFGIDWPVFETFDFTGGALITPEYAALLMGLVVYAAAFIAEIVRSGIESVGRGQWEAASALGLSRRDTLRHVVLPQAMKVSLAPATSEYLAILKNSSLAVAIGYQEIVSVGNTMLYETGQAVEVVGLTMAFYVVVSLVVSGLMNRYDASIAR